MNLKAFVLCGALIFSINILCLKEKISDSGNYTLDYENELFDFETTNSENSDFFYYQEADALQAEKNQSRIDKLKQWFLDQYNYFLLRCFIFYIDLKDKKDTYSSLLRSYYQSFYSKIRKYWKTLREQSRFE